ncbi:MAG: hypothetical protein ACRD1Y_06700 [Terriglobales bacterium]
MMYTAFMRPRWFPALILFGIVGLVLAAAPATAHAQKKKNTVITVRVTVTVLNPQGHPVQGAGVVLKQLRDANGVVPREPFDVELHTDEKGKVTVQGFSPGVVLVQVIDTVYNTYGQAFIMSKADESVHVHLKPPQAQVSDCCRP